MLASEWLIDIGAYTGAGQVTLRYSVSGYVTGPDDDPANTVYEGRISSIGAFGRHLFGEGQTLGAVSINMGDLVLANADGALDDMVSSYGLDGQPFVLRRLPSPRAPLSAAEIVWTGVLEGVDSDSGMLMVRLKVYDRRRDVDIPIQKDTYGGTSTSAGATADGSPDMKGNLKPLCFGACFSVPATVVNAHNAMLQFSASPLAMIALMDGGAELVNDGDVANLAALAAATGNPGHYKTCLALGMAKPFGTVNGKPETIWTADILEGGSPPERSPGMVVYRMMDKIGLADQLDADSLMAFLSVATQEVGLYIDTETSALAAIRQVLGSVGATMYPNAIGMFEVERFAGPGIPVAIITDDDIITASKDDVVTVSPNPDTQDDIPAYKVIVKYHRNWHVHTDSDLVGCANFGNPMRGSALQQEWLEEKAEDASVQVRHKLAKDLTFETCLTTAGAAAVEAARLLPLYSADREVIRISVAFDADNLLKLNKTVTVKLNRLGYDAGKPFVIIGRTDDYGAERTDLVLWG